jgi:hypothetical protein
MTEAGGRQLGIESREKPQLPGIELLRDYSSGMRFTHGTCEIDTGAQQVSDGPQHYVAARDPSQQGLRTDCSHGGQYYPQPIGGALPVQRAGAARPLNAPNRSPHC